VEAVGQEQAVRHGSEVRPRPALAFTGFMASGKSTFAKIVARTLGEELADVDELLERRLELSVDEIFARRGEESFRMEEKHAAIEAIRAGGVVALGGGAVETPTVREALAEAIPVWCEVPERLAWERARATGRPLARDRAEFRRRFALRAPLYEEVARAVVPGLRRETATLVAPWLAALREHPDLRLAWARTASAEYPVLCGEGAVDALGRGHRARRLY
jgi:shikimate kinase